MRHSERLQPPVANASDVWRCKEVSQPDGLAEASRAIRQRPRAEGDMRRMKEFLRIDRGQEA